MRYGSPANKTWGPAERILPSLNPHCARGRARSATRTAHVGVRTPQGSGFCRPLLLPHDPHLPLADLHRLQRRAFAQVGDLAQIGRQ